MCMPAAWGMDQEIPDYDMDSEDEHWLTKQTKKMEVSPLKFENMMDRLEKGSGQTVSTAFFILLTLWITCSIAILFSLL